MTIKTLEEQIKTKADRDARVALCRFRDAVGKAWKELIGSNFATMSSPDSKKAMLVLAGELPATGGWPSEIWRIRESRLRDEVMSTMNTLQQILLAKKTSGDDDDGCDQPQEQSDGEGKSKA